MSPAVVVEWQQLRAVSCPQGPTEAAGGAAAPSQVCSAQQCPSLWSCSPPWQVFPHKEHKDLRVTREAQGPPGLRLSCATVKPAEVALQWSCHSATAEADLAGSASAACHPAQSPPSQQCHTQLQIQCISGEGEEATIALIPCLGRASAQALCACSSTGIGL